LGSNHIAAGFTGVEVYVAAMRSGVQAHLNAFVSFVLADHVKLTALQTHNWAGFAARYNGPGYAADGYDKRLAEAYAENGGA
jgi:predicted Kef-type K+ transport protein